MTTEAQTPAFQDSDEIVLKALHPAPRKKVTCQHCTLEEAQTLTDPRRPALHIGVEFSPARAAFS